MCKCERAVGWKVEEALVESGGEEADRGPTLNQRQRQQTAHVEVQVLTQSYTETHTQHQH